MGNLRSVGKALEHVGAEPFLTSEHARVREADGIVLPGVGAMPKAMERVRDLELDQLLRERVEAEVPVIGLCMGMQLLFDSTTEMGGAEGIGLLRGPVEALDAPGLKVPQIGWNPVTWRRAQPCSTRGCRRRAPSTTPTRSRRGPTTRTPCSAPRTTGASS